MHRTAVFAIAIALAGCATQFYGSPKVDKGPAGCKSACNTWGMELAGMVKMGVSALQIPNLNLQSVAFDDAREKITGLSSDQISFTH